MVPSPYFRLLCQTAAGKLFQHPIEAAQMFVSVALALCQVQSRVRPRVADPPPHNAGKLDAIHVGGDNGNAPCGAASADGTAPNKRPISHSRTKSGRRAQI